LSCVTPFYLSTFVLIPGSSFHPSLLSANPYLLLQIVKYLNRLPDVLPAVNTALQNLGDGNWKMGAGVGKGGNIRAKGAGAADEGELLEHFISKSPLSTPGMFRVP
jgi:hypothetical protein